MRGLVVIGAMVLTTCGGGSTPMASVTPSGVISPLPTVTPSTIASPSPSVLPSTSPTPAPPPVITITAAGKSLACRLPVTWQIQVDDFTLLHKFGFITFPSGKLTEDRAAPQTSMFYDRASSKWLSVGRNQVSPDGRRYAYTDGNPIAGDTKGKVHLVDLATGRDTVLYNGAPVFYVIDFAAEGIYLSASGGEGYGRGLWLESTSGGTPRLINRSIIGPVLDHGVAWGIAFNAADPHPGPAGLEGPYNELTRMDLATGSSTSFFYRPGTTIQPFGIDQSGRLFVGVLKDWNGPKDVWRITSPTEATRIATFTSALSPDFEAAIDRHGMWLSGGWAPTDHQPLSEITAVWLYVGGTFRTLATVQTDGFTIAGGCIP